MATKVSAKSILKQPKLGSTAADEAAAKASRDQHNYNVALQQAHLIQNQKDWQNRILKAIEVLIEYPASTTTFTPQEAQSLARLILPFQPSDLDALIEERCIDGKCGYALCSRPPRVLALGKDAEWKVGKFAQQFCSSGCARKAAGLKVQLSEVPIWERDPTVQLVIALPEEDRPKDALPTSASLASRIDGSAVAKASGDPAQAANELALERGEKATSLRPRQVMTDMIVEKAKVVHTPLRGLDNAIVSSTAIEGYEPRVRTKVGFVDPTSDHSDHSDDDDDDD
ncbi:hypothetical protein LTR62_004810 [Meristemomyces frigidus]|uniref:RNA polymerase II subunit B1 CTD phosphatase RPAP2 homolog n=1 Tax=Meristemomyces frigidus TaxID=1508187 RepID=A0AAN7TGD7_9PEZI|nr:hypothetical protein LTR62_004810 [Meristemomyces frigidus]